MFKIGVIVFRGDEDYDLCVVMDCLSFGVYYIGCVWLWCIVVDFRELYMELVVVLFVEKMVSMCDLVEGLL